MKYCPECHKQYTEQWITFCHEDGAILVETGYTPSAQPPPGGQRPYAPPYAPEHDWRSPDPNAPGSWVPPQQQQPVVQSPWAPPPPPQTPGYRQQPSQGLAVASMVVGVVGLVLGFCLGPIPGIAALILGLVALHQINKSPDKYSGKPLAIIGVALGSLSLLVFIGWLLLAIIGNLAG